MHVRRLSWLGIRTENYDGARDFFGRVLGLALIAEESGLAMFQLPGGTNDFVEVFDVANPEGAWMTSAPVAGLLVDDVVQARDELVAEGIKIVGDIQWLRDYEGFEDVTEYGWFNFRGPDGNLYNCMQGSRALPE